MKYILITGATSGIGLALAKLLTSKGHQLAICGGHNRKNFDHALKELSKNGAKPLAYFGDCKDPDFDRRMMEDIFLHFPRLDALINNAGRSYVGLLTDMTLEQWDDIIGTNLNSLFYLCRLAVPSMVRQHSGRIINISSMWGQSGASCEVAYSASKGGVDSFTKALAKELAPSGIQVNAVSFGTIDTPMNACFTDEEKAALSEDIPAGRFGTPDEAATLIAQLLEAPDYLTGQVIRMDGGYL
ncbi:MAG: SDR family NAD(P)-dependent oxidoreductase [Lachnospiraceae bacterium]|nr:SDR family NAD(P)-dependent oxidoreductase [Lachnospiraceae bacterium]